MWLVGLESCAMALPGQNDVECWFLCPPNLSSSSCTPRSQEARPRPAAALLGHSCYQMSDVPSLLHTQQSLHFLVLLSLDTAFLPSNACSWHHMVQLHCFGTRKRERRKSNKYITPIHWRRLWAELRQFLCSQHHSKSWALHHLWNTPHVNIFKLPCYREEETQAVIHRPDVLDQENESGKGQILLL